MPPQPSDPNIPAGWEVVQDSPTQAATGVPDGWEVVEDAKQAPSNDMGLLSAASAAGAAAIPTAKLLADKLAGLTTQVAAPVANAIGFTPRAGLSAAAPAMQTVASPLLKGATAVAGRVAAPLNIGMAAYDYATGKRSLTGAATQAAGGEFARRMLMNPGRMMKGAQVLQRVATPVANALGAEGVAGMAAPVAVPLAGGLAGVAGTAGFLGALQHDANRTVTTDYTKNTPDTDIAKVFMNMRNSEANRGRSLDERMDDPNDVMFRPDDSADVRAAVVAALGR